MESKTDDGAKSAETPWVSWLAKRGEANPLVGLLRRVYSFLQRQGLRALAARAILEIRHLLKGHRMVLFCCDGSGMDGVGRLESTSGHIERIQAASELAPCDFDRLLMAGDPLTIKKGMEERFAEGASLWLFKVQDRVAGFGWTIVGHTVEPYFFPLAPYDVHFFDFFVLPEYRGNRINPSLIKGILEQGVLLGNGRAYIECWEWNQPQLASLKRTPFQKLAVATKRTLFGRTMVSWRQGLNPDARDHR